jgi:putative transposase
MLLVHKIELKANRQQATYFAKGCGVSRFAYNWALDRWQKEYALDNKPTEAKLRKALNAIKKTEFPWMQEVTKVAPQQAIKNLGTAYTRFFKKLGKHPRFKKRGVHDSFRADNGPSKVGADAVTLEGKKIKLPRIGWVRLRETLRYTGQIKSVTISRRADRWYAAIVVDTTSLIHERKNHGSVGVDLGIKTFAQLSTGQAYEGAKAHKAKLKRLRCLSRALSRKRKGSRNRAKAKLALSRLHAQIANIRADSLHKLTTELVLNYTRIGIEDLNVSGMASNRRLSRHIMDQSFYEFRRQLSYKSDWYGSELVIADRFFPSSKRCNTCDELYKDLTLSERYWTCSHCNTYHDRDLNAAINLYNYLSTASSAGIDACEVEGAGARIVYPDVKPCHVEARIQH